MVPRILGVVLLVVAANVVFNVVALPHLQLPDLPDLPSLPDVPGVPDVPGWILFALGKVKLVAIGVLVLLAIAGEELARRRGKDGPAA